MLDALEVVAPAGVQVDYQDERLEIRPFTIGEAAQVIRVAQPVVAALMERDVDSLAAGDDVLMLLDLVGSHSDAMFAVAALATRRELEWIKGAGVDQFIGLALAVFQVNRDFFGQRIAPLLAGLRAKPESGNGPTRSSSLSSTATPSTTSADTR